MTTKQLAMYIVAGVAVFAGLFGMIPPLLNAHSTLLNALGAALAFTVVLAAVLTVHATHAHHGPPREHGRDTQSNTKSEKE